MILIWITLGIFAIGLIISGTCYGNLKNICLKYEKYRSSFNLTGSEFINRSINHLNLNSHYTIVEGEFTDKFLIKQDVIVLSNKTAESMSITAISIASHELGHAIQKNKNSMLIYLNSHLSILNKIAEILILPLFIVGLILFLIPATYAFSINVFIITVCLWLATILYKLLLIPLEFNASKLAYNYLQQLDTLSSKELKMAKKIMNAAGLTYIGGLFFNLLKFFKSIFKSFDRK